jgi:predicted ABC-type ATPase
MTPQAHLPTIYIFAGPNGAGKTTFALEYLADHEQSMVFVNADVIAAGLSPHAPEAAAIAAGRLMLAQIEQLVASRKSFAFETTLSARSYAQKIPSWQEAGYAVNLFFLSLPDSEQAKQRVAQRVRQGGHSIPADVIERRFIAGLTNFEALYKGIVNRWVLYDARGTIPFVLDEGSH